MTRISNYTIWLLVCFVALFAWSYHDTLLSLHDTWNSNPDYQHGYFVLPIAFAILWRRREEFQGETTVAWSGLLLIALAAFVRWFAVRFFFMELDAWSILLWLGGAFWVAGGFRFFCWALPAIAFLGFATPLPGSVALALSNQLQAIAAAGSAFGLQCLGRPAILDGTTVLLNGIELDIARACSGLRMFFGVFAVAFGFGMLGKAGKRITTLLVFLAVPVSLLGNIVRIMVTGLLFEITDDQTARQLEHDFAGLAMMVFVLSVFTWVSCQLRWWRIASERRPQVFARRVAFWPITIALMIAGIFGVHHIQAGNAVQQLVQMAEIAESTGDEDEAARYWDLVLRMDSNHEDGLRNLSNILGESGDYAARRRALELATRSSNRNPEDLFLAKRRIEIANTLSAHGDTISAANRILTHPDIANVSNIAYRKFAARWRANAIYSLLHSLDAPRTLNWDDLGEALETAIEHDPNYPQHYLRLAINYRTRIKDRTSAELADSADATVKLMIDRNPESGEAWLGRYRYAKQFAVTATIDQAGKATIDGYLDRAFELHQASATKNAHILVSVAERERVRGNTMASVELFQRAIDVDPADTRPYLAISEMVAEPGNPDSLDMSIKVLQDGVRAIGNRELPLILPLIRHLSARGQAKEAASYIDTARRTIEGIPDEQRTDYKIQLGYVEALILARENRFAEAADHLQVMVESFDSNEIRLARRQIAQVWGNVAQYRRMSGDFASLVEAYKKAASLDSSWRAHMLQWATRTRSPRQDADAMPQGLAPTSRDPWVDAARFALRQQLLLPPPVRDWSQYRHAIESARDDAVIDEVICLDANYHAINGQWEQAEALLRQATIDHPKSPLIFRTLALLYTKQGELDSAIQLVGEIAPEDLQEASLVLLKSELLCTASRYDEALALLNRATESSQDVNLANELQVEVARILTRVGDWEQAKQILSSIRADGEGALRVVEMLSRLAWCQRDWETLEDCENRLRTIEGSKGALWRTCRIRRLLGQSNDRSSKGIVEATALAEALQKDHPDLQMTKVSSARVATYRGLLWEAVSHYENAWQSGSPRVTLAVDLIALLNELGQTGKAQRYVNDARMFMRASDQMIDRTLIDFVYDTDIDAIRFAEAWVQSHESSDGYLRYGRTLALAAIPGIEEEAERLELARFAFEKAVKLDPRDIRAWGALYRFYAAARPNPAKAREVLERLATHEEITELDRAFALAQLRESIGQIAMAAEMYDQSIELLGEDVDALSHLVVYERSAQFFRSHDLSKAALCSRSALKIDPASIGAKSVLIDVLLAQSTVDSISEAETLFVSAIDENGLSDSEKRRRAEILRAKASVIAGERQQLLTQAVKALESISQKTTIDNLMMALTNLELKMPTSASQQMTMAIVAKNLDVPVLVRFIDEHRELLQSHEAFGPVLERAFLRIEETEGFEIESLRLRLSQLKLSEPDRTEDDLKNLESLIIDQHTDRCLRRLRVDSKRDQLAIGVLDFLLKTNRGSDAARLAKLSPPPVSRLRWTTTLAVALAMNHSTVADSEEADQLLTRRLKNYADSGELNFAVGNLRLLQGENDVAVDCYRIALSQNPSHWLTMNNLALALVDSNLEESFSLVEKAFELAGRDPVLLDTLALLQLRNNEPQLAIETMQEALPNAEFGVSGLIHLAMAWKQVGDTQQAQSTFELIDHNEITAKILSPIDREMYVALKQELIK